MSKCTIKTKKWHLHRAKTRISLGIVPVWSKSLLYAQWVAEDPSFMWTVKTDQAGRMPRLIPSRRWSYMPFCWFCHALAHIHFRSSCQPAQSDHGLCCQPMLSTVPNNEQADQNFWDLQFLAWHSWNNCQDVASKFVGLLPNLVRWQTQVLSSVTTSSAHLFCNPRRRWKGEPQIILKNKSVYPNRKYPLENTSPWNLADLCGTPEPDSLGVGLGLASSNIFQISCSDSPPIDDMLIINWDLCVGILTAVSPPSVFILALTSISVSWAVQL